MGGHYAKALMVPEWGSVMLLQEPTELRNPRALRYLCVFSSLNNCEAERSSWYNSECPSGLHGS